MIKLTNEGRTLHIKVTEKKKTLNIPILKQKDGYLEISKSQRMRMDSILK